MALRTAVGLLGIYSIMYWFLMPYEAENFVVLITGSNNLLSGQQSILSSNYHGKYAIRTIVCSLLRHFFFIGAIAFIEL